MKKLAQKIISKTNRQGVSFTLCVLLAAFIWVINALNNVHSTSVIIPIIYDKEISKNSTHPLPPSIHIDVKGRGFSLWSFHNAARNFSIQTPYLNSRTKDTVISSKDAISSLLYDFSKEITISEIKPAQLIFSGVKFYSKKLAVKGNFKLSFQTPFIQSSPSIYYPDSVWVYSNNKIPPSVTDIYAETVTEKNVSHSIFKKVKLKKPFETYRLLQNNVWLMVPVEEGTEIELDVPIQAKYGELFIPSSVQVTCMVPMSKYNQTHHKQFKVVQMKGTGSDDKAFIEVLHAPYWASRVMVEPQHVNKLTKSFD
jgi:hypothetical protein